MGCSSRSPVLQAHHLLLDKLTVKPVTTHPFYVGEPWPPAGATLSTGLFNPPPVDRERTSQRKKICPASPVPEVFFLPFLLMFSLLLQKAKCGLLLFFFIPGHYCVGGAAFPCPAGTYSPKEGLQRLRDCTICPAGRVLMVAHFSKPII